VGPDLAGIADRMSTAELRLTVVNPRIANPRTRMPAYHHVSLALAARAPALRQPWLSPRQVEDVVAYLATLGETPPPPPGPDAASPPAAP
jgi:sulfur-oxidizing protein SoxX